MYAVLHLGGRQYKVTTGDIIQVDKMPKDKGDEIEFENVLMLASDSGTEIGTPRVPGAMVRARVLRNGRGKKILVVKSRRRKGFAKRRGHRSDFTEVRITGVFKGEKELKATAPAAEANA